MIKHFSQTAIATILAFGSLTTTAATADGLTARNQRSRAEISMLRAARPRPLKASASPLKVMGGTNQDRQLYGLHCPSYYGDSDTGIAEIGDGSFSWVKKFDSPAFQGCYMGDKYLTIFYDAENPDGVAYEYFDTKTWNSLSRTDYVTDMANILPYALTYDHTSGVVYGCFFQTESWMMDTDAQFGYISDDPVNPTHVIGELPERMRAMGTDKSGQIYGISFTGGLYKINKLTAETEKVMDLQIPSTSEDLDPDTFNSMPWGTYGRESIAFDWETGYLYLAYGDEMDDTFIAQVDINDGTVEIVSDFSYYTGSGTSEVFSGIYFIQESEVTGAVPAAVSDISVEPVGTQLKANVTFTMPVADSEGNSLTGTLDWHIANGSTDLASGQAQAGATVTETVTLTAEGNIPFIVYASLNNANGAPTSTAKWIGPDTPVIDGRPTISASGNKVTVSWTAARSEHGGNLDQVRYKVVRMPDNRLVTDQCADLKTVDNIESEYKTLYHYEITPVAGTKEGATVESRSRYVGTYFAMPFTEDFTDNDRFLQYPISDNNKDENIWDINLNKKAAIYQGNSNAADDYLLIGPFKMKTGGLYSFRMLAGGHTMVEHVAVYTATFGNDGKAAIEDFIPVTLLNPLDGDKTLSKSFTPDKDGDYYFAIAACSGANSQILYIYEVTVNEFTGELPATPENVQFVPEATTATIRFTMPSKSVNGNAATGLTEARIYRDGNLIGSVTQGVRAGAALSFTDTETVSDGFHTYSITAVSSSGEGPSTDISGYRGLDYPGTPDNLRIWEDLATTGLLHITFDAPKRGYNGGYINPDDITYKLDYLLGSGASGETDLGKGTTHTFKVPGNVTIQDLFGGSVYGSNATGAVRQSWRTNVCSIGPAIAIPLQESWAGMSQKSGTWFGQAIGNEALSESYWNISDGSNISIKPQDGDGGMMALSNEVAERGHRIVSPRVTLGNANKPTLIFYYQYTAAAQSCRLEVIVDDQEIRTLREIDTTDGNAGKWMRCEVPLDEFAGKKYVQFAFTGTSASTGAYFAIDNVTISDFVSNDLAIKEISAPAKSGINEKMQLSLLIRNNGSSTVAAGDYSILLYKNGELADEIAGRQISADSELTFTLTDTPLVTDPTTTEYSAEISYAADGNTSNNKSRTVSVRIITPAYPAVTDLSGTPMNGVTLHWSDPSTADMPGTPVTESFESYQAFGISGIGEWTLHDGDKCPTVILSLGTGALDYPNIGQPMAWQIFDPTEAAIPFEVWVPRTGNHILVSYQACANNQRTAKSDDWLISPELNGSKQTVSFYARAAMSSYSPEVFDFMISDGGNATNDFEPLASDVEVPYTTGLEWTEFTYTVPAGTRYFAIVHKSVNKLVMLLDDITYIPAGSQPIALELQGFNIYRDGKRINSEPVVDNDYADTETVEGTDYTYAVTAVWDKGESALSNTVTVKAKASIESITDHKLLITAADGALRIDGGTGEHVCVYSIAGTLVGDSKADGTIFIPVPTAGLYIVKAGNSVAKIAVR